jgi:Protease inhibitor Inh
MTRLYSVAVATALAFQVAAALDPQLIQSTAGYWFLGIAESGKGCNLKLLTDEAIGGHAVEAPAHCTVGKVSAADIGAWNLDGKGGLILLDPLRHVLLHLEENENGIWTATSESGDMVLAPSGKDVAALPTAKGAAGTFELARPGGTALCRLTLADKPQASGEGNFALTVAAGCDPAVTALKLDGWMVEGIALTLSGPGGHSVIFHADGKDGFVKAPGQGKPLLMTRVK